ncbi:MAG: ArsR/SmtB family transcription factor [Candidatus Dadabacteria bacterium]
MTKVATSPAEELMIDTKSSRKAALIIRAINHKLRQQILALIHEHKLITVTEIYEKLGLEQSVASQHLAVLRHAQFVHTKRDGKFIFYSVNYKRIEEAKDCANQLTKS